MTSTASRRAFLSVGAAAVATVGVPAANAWSQDSADDELEALWERWRSLYVNGLRISRACREATDRLPWWAAPGPSHLPADTGGIVGWPAIQDAEPPPEGSSVCRVVRPGLGDFKRWLKQETEMRGERIARERYRSQVRALAKRRYAQKLEYRKVGLLALDKESDANGDACLDTARAIEALPVTSFSVTAARLLIDFHL